MLISSRVAIIRAPGGSDGNDVEGRRAPRAPTVNAVDRPLRALLVEDSAADAEMIVRALERDGWAPKWERVEDARGLGAALDRGGWDVVLSDYSLPRFSAPEALAVVRARKVDVPFVIVSGTVDEETAVASMKAGASDFLSKQRLARLGAAVARELREAEGRRARLRAERERQRLQVQLLAADRLASLGIFAAGIAHEISSPLSYALVNLELIAEELQASDGQLGDRLGELQEMLADARDGMERVRRIVGDVKSVSRVDGERRDPIDVRQVLDGAVRIATFELRRHARVVKDYRDVPPVPTDEGRLGQVFLNLLMNAAQAIPEGDSEHNEIRLTVRAEAAAVVVEVRDTGSGMPEEIRERIFEPFFTTKPVGVGTGLGLSLCRDLVSGLGGRIEVESRVGEGTAFRVSLPVGEGAEPGR